MPVPASPADQDRSNYGKSPQLEKRKSAIKETARQMILRQGISASSMKDLAVACGLGRKTLYRFFASMDDIAQQILLDYASAADSFTATYRISGADWREKIRHAIRSYYEYGLSHEDLWLFYYEYDYHFRTPHRELIHGFWKGKANVFELILREGVAEGSFKVDADKIHPLSLTIANSIIATLQRIMLRKQVYLVEYGYGVDDVALLVDLLVDGIP